MDATDATAAFWIVVLLAPERHNTHPTSFHYNDALCGDMALGNFARVLDVAVATDGDVRCRS